MLPDVGVRPGTSLGPLCQIGRAFDITSAQRCKGMAGLLAEGDNTLSEAGGGLAKDAAIIAAAQRE